MTLEKKILPPLLPGFDHVSGALTNKLSLLPKILSSVIAYLSAASYIVFGGRVPEARDHVTIRGKAGKQSHPAV